MPTLDPVMRDRREQVLITALSASILALRSYQYGNSAPGLAETVADAGELALASIGKCIEQ